MIKPKEKRFKIIESDILISYTEFPRLKKDMEIIINKIKYLPYKDREINQQNSGGLMSAQTKTRAQKAAKLLGIALFAFLMFFNIKFALGDNSNGDIDLFGLKVSVVTNTTYAYLGGAWEIEPWVTKDFGDLGTAYLFTCTISTPWPNCASGSAGWGFIN